MPSYDTRDDIYITTFIYVTNDYMCVAGKCHLRVSIHILFFLTTEYGD